MDNADKLDSMMLFSLLFLCFNFRMVYISQILPSSNFPVFIFVDVHVMLLYKIKPDLNFHRCKLSQMASNPHANTARLIVLNRGKIKAHN